jgi:hypothetical protein
MRRVQAIIVVVALLATPLALLAHAASVGNPGCNRMCCLQHHSHPAHTHHPAKTATAQGAFCHLGGAHQDCSCSMRAGDQQMDYGFLAPIVPATPSAIASVVIPNATRRIASPISALLTTGFLSAPFEPPRA